MKKRKKNPWMKADVYGQSLQGLTINLISTDLDRTLVFQEHVLGADIVYHDADFAAIQGYGAKWMVHTCLLYTSPSPRDLSTSRMPSSA